MANWFKACPQSLIGIVHFSEAFRTAKYSILNIASSVENVDNIIFLLLPLSCHDHFFPFGISTILWSFTQFLG